MISAVSHKVFKTLLALCLVLSALQGYSQTVIDTTRRPADTVIARADVVIDSVLRVHSPRTAAIRSAIIPGWGQVYNKKYWKLPLVYGALGTTAYIFFDNLKTYRDLRFTYAAKYKASLPPFNPNFPDRPGPYQDSTDYFKIKSRYINLDLQFLRYNRDEFRRNIDYSVLVFILFWGLQVVDATVDAHLKSFDVSPDLSFKMKPGYSALAQTNGVSLVLQFK